MPPVAQPPSRFHALDVTRGLAALAVVFFHWHHFFFADGVMPPASLHAQFPGYAWLAPLYERGWMAVDLFFLLSGFIFYWLYGRSIADGRTGGREFFWLRFSRLYPLHALTLVVVIVGQWIYFRQTGTHFVYANDDAYHFVLNLFLASGWGLEHTYSFNGPIWSVSTECALYLLFFVMCRWLPVSAPVLLLASFIGTAGGVFGLMPSALARGVSMYFLGGVVYLFYAQVLQRGGLERLWRPALVLAIIAWALGLASLGLTLPSRGAVHVLLTMYPRFVMFPLLVLALALLETRRGSLGARWSFIGDLSYASYLLHFPLQLVLMIVITALGFGPTLFLSPIALIGFFVLLIALSLATYHGYERPAQRWLRQRLVARRAARPAVAPRPSVSSGRQG